MDNDLSYYDIFCLLLTLVLLGYDFIIDVTLCLGRRMFLEEQIIFNQEGVKVTPTRFIADGQTYPISGITSVRVLVDYPSKKWPIALITPDYLEARLFYLFTHSFG